MVSPVALLKQARPAPALKRLNAQIVPQAEAKAGAPGRIRTCDPKLRRLVLYPTELRAPALALTRFAAQRNRLALFRRRGVG